MNHEDNLPMVRKLAWHFHSLTGLDFEDLESRAMYEYARAVHKYDENRAAKFTTFAWAVIRNNLLTYCAKQARESAKFEMVSLDDLEACENDCDQVRRYILPSDDSYNPDRLAAISNALCIDLSQDAREVVRIIFESPHELIENTKNLSPRNLRGTLCRMLRDREWAWSRIWSSMSEIKEMVNAN